MKTYTTISGDMWDAIAYSELGNVNYMGKLLMNNTKYADHFILPAGIVLNLPEATEEIQTNEMMPPWKR